MFDSLSVVLVGAVSDRRAYFLFVVRGEVQQLLLESVHSAFCSGQLLLLLHVVTFSQVAAKTLDKPLFLLQHQL